MDRRSLVLGLLVTSGASPACTSGGAAQREDALLSRQVDQLRQRAVRDQKTLRELENRIFVLEERLDRPREEAPSAAAPTPPAPSAPALVPPPDERPPAAPDPGARASSGSVSEPSVEIVYEGDALVTSGRRPTLLMDDRVAPVREDGARVEPRTQSRRPRGIRADRRLLARKTEPSPPVPAQVTDRIPVAATPGAPLGEHEAETTYRDAYAALLRGRHALAIAGFLEFLERWPQHDNADNAQYWIGEARYDQRDFRHALLEFKRVVEKYPTGNKSPDALLKVGYCYANLGDTASAKQTLSRVVAQFPKTEAAKLAARRMAELR